MSEHVTHTPHVRRLERTTDRILGGVCGGLGRYFDLNPAFFRLGFVVLTLLGGAGILVYLAALVVIPDERNERSLAEQVVAERRDRPWPLIALALGGAAVAVLLSHASAWPAAGAGWVVVLVGAVVVLWATRSERRAGRILRLAVALAVLAAALVVAALVAAFAWFDVSLGDGIGDRTYTPATAADVHQRYDLGVGNLQLDLSAIGATPQPRHVSAHVGVGKLRIVVPANLPVVVDAHADAGDVYVFRQHDNGTDADIHTGDRGRLTIDAKVGAGRVDVVRAAG